VLLPISRYLNPSKPSPYRLFRFRPRQEAHTLAFKVFYPKPP